MLSQMTEFPSFLWLNNIPLYILYIHKHTHTHIYIYHIFFIHSSVDGNLGFSHILAIVNNAAMNIGLHVPFRIRVFMGIQISLQGNDFHFLQIDTTQK